jgi:predicted transcriptional regulator of viral defense system
MRMSYTSKVHHLPQGRAMLALVLSKAGDVVHVADAVGALGLSRSEAAKRLARWTEQGWLHRVGRGAYVPVSLDTLGAERVLDDPWVLVPALYGRCYIGGRTAAEHWDLTEQIFKDIVVMTTQAIRERHQQRHGASFTLRHIKEENVFGTKPVWRHQSKVAVSDIHRTIIDMLDEPAIGGGIQHVADCLVAYLARADRDDRRLIDYADRLGNGAVFKRLGFLAERVPTGQSLGALCLPKLTAGNAKLDPALECARLVARWRLFVPKAWAKGDRA